MRAHRVQDLLAARRVVDRPRKQQCAHERTHQVRHAVAVFFRVVAQPQRGAEPVDVRRQPARVSAARSASQPRRVRTDRDHHATRATVVAVPRRKIAVDQQPRPRRSRRQRRDPIEIRDRRIEGRRARLRDQLRLVLKMRVEAAVRQPGAPHDFVDARFGDAALAKRQARRLDDASARGVFVGGRIAHG